MNAPSKKPHGHEPQLLVPAHAFPPLHIIEQISSSTTQPAETSINTTRSIYVFTHILLNMSLPLQGMTFALYQYRYKTEPTGQDYLSLPDILHI